VESALKLVPVSSYECNALLHFHRERGREIDALPVLAEWIRKHPDLYGAHPAYLVLVERYGTDKERDIAINETSAWLAQHSEDANLRTVYLGLVEWRGIPEEMERVMQETSAWLALHPEDTSVRTAYLGLVERRGIPEEVEWVMQETSAWLDSHPNATNVWDRVIASYVRLQRADEALKLAEKAISIHSRNANLVIQYLKLMQDQLDDQRVREFYADLMNTHSGDSGIKNSYGRWLNSRGYLDEAEDILKSLIGNSPQYYQAKHSYGRLLLDLERYGEAADQFRKALKIHPGFQMARDGLAQALRGLASQAEKEERAMDAQALLADAERELHHAIFWAGRQGQQQAQFHTHLGWFYIDRERWRDALESFRRAMLENPDYWGNYWGQGHSLFGLGRFQEALNILHIALEKAPEDFQPPASREIPDLMEKCRAALVNNLPRTS
jgi:tetratricopeptide (TPR) repeat protein